MEYRSRRNAGTADGRLGLEGNAQASDSLKRCQDIALQKHFVRNHETRSFFFAIAFGVRTRPRVGFWFPCVYEKNLGSLPPHGDDSA
jgi:hypothetical protein